jgi:hypothetical protein
LELVFAEPHGNAKGEMGLGDLEQNEHPDEHAWLEW